jgi:ABC-type multidrug transport system fused ATPase/permease subunit
MDTPPSAAATPAARRRFRGATPADPPVAPPLDLRGARKTLAEVLPNATLEALATQTQAQDQRKRKLTCVVFFWLLVLAMGPGGPLSLSSLVSFLVVAYAMAGLSVAAATLSRQTLSANLKLRPWQFFEAVLSHLLGVYAGLVVGTTTPLLDLALLQQLILVDATVLRVADRLIQVFPGHKTGRKAEWAAIKLHTAFRLFRSVPRVLAVTAEKVNEKSVNFLRPVGEKVLYVFDLGYWKYELFDQIIDRQQHFISRLRADCNPLIKEVYQGCQEWVGKRLKEITLGGEEVDLLVNLSSAGAANPQMQHDVRLVGQPVAGVWHLYVTSILDRVVYVVGLIAQIYALRWQIEIFFRDLKCVLRIENFIATTENGVRLQIYAALIFYVLTHIVMLKAAQRVQTSVEQMSVPKCLTAMSQALIQTTELVIKGWEPDWAVLEERLVTIIAAIHPRPKRKQPSRLAQAVREFLAPAITPAAASP